MTAIDDVVAALERNHRIVVGLVRQVDPTVLKRRPESTKWSIHEHACHLATVHPLFFERLEIMLSSPAPIIKSYDPGRDDAPDALLHVDLDAAMQRYEQERRRLVERLRQLTPVDWTRTAEHDEYNSYSMFTMLRHVALHDLHHAYQIEALMLRRHWPAPTPFCG